MTNGKQCSRCHELKSLLDFGSTKANKDGLCGQCRSCRAAIQRERRQSDPKYAERQRDVLRKRRAEGRRCPSEALKPKRGPARGSPEWLERRIWTNRLSSAKTNAQRYGARINDLSLSIWMKVLESYGRACGYCGSRVDLQIDHVVPLSVGGQNTKSNVVPACLSCNYAKSTKSVQQFLANMCRNDHPKTVENTYIPPSGKKVCRSCVRESEQRYKARLKAKKELTWATG